LIYSRVTHLKWETSSFLLTKASGLVEPGAPQEDVVPVLLVVFINPIPHLCDHIWDALVKRYFSKMS
jgi:hypothetical protein